MTSHVIGDEVSRKDPLQCQQRVRITLGITLLVLGLLAGSSALAAYYGLGLGVVGASVLGGCGVAFAGAGILLLFLSNFQGKDERRVQEFLKRKELSDVNAKDEKGYTPLHFAVLQNNTKLLKALLKVENIDVNAKDSQEETALHFAAIDGNKAIVNRLIAKEDIDLESKNKSGQTPSDLAKNEEIKGLLLQPSDSSSQ